MDFPSLLDSGEREDYFAHQVVHVIYRGAAPGAASGNSQYLCHISPTAEGVIFLLPLKWPVEADESQLAGPL